LTIYSDDQDLIADVNILHAIDFPPDLGIVNKQPDTIFKYIWNIIDIEQKQQWTKDGSLRYSTSHILSIRTNYRQRINQ
jgi:hypothetical protein